MILLLDIGNTRIKWAVLGERGLAEQQAAAHAGWTQRDIVERVLLSGERATRVLVANVGGARIAASVREAILATWGVEPQFVHASAQAAGVRNAYSDPTQLGVDRWLTLLAAHRMKLGAVCIAGVGTAMTVDGLDASGRHLGGLILPGPDLMARALLRNTSDLAERAQRGYSSDAFFANNTFGAIHQGAGHALAALVERAVESMGATAGGEPRLLLTGGAAARVEPAIRRPFESIPDLVLRGLAVLAGRSAGVD